MAIRQEIVAMAEHLSRLYDDWELEALRSDDDATTDDFYYRGAQSFRDFLAEHLPNAQEKSQ